MKKLKELVLKRNEIKRTILTEEDKLQLLYEQLFEITNEIISRIENKERLIFEKIETTQQSKSILERNKNND